MEVGLAKIVKGSINLRDVFLRAQNVYRQHKTMLGDIQRGRNL